ncbi:uncharacterized protein LOC126374189 isoform X3 [Pectinophora gossypiella]|uniref:uncharacterized protein LOC126374189 isoform X3 n=1 Tax=Pectinophora gossypiella TaxID=13191 RepID=UPI00214F57A8|nr:uncharacterized protein LOC126374189 isoform X3 [Pectinophora gossypiella]
MDFKTLKRSRASCKSKLTIFKQYLEGIKSINDLNRLHVHELTNRLDKIKEMYNEFDSIQTNIESLTDISDEVELEERKIFETSYFQAVAVAEDMIERSSAARNPVSCNDSVTGSVRAVHLELVTELSTDCYLAALNRTSKTQQVA